MNVLLVTLGSHGDLFPFLAIGRALARRGHSCRIATHPFFHAEIAAAGLEPITATPGFPVEELIRHPDLFHRLRGPLLLGRHVGAAQREMAADLRRLVAGSRVDAIVAHYGASAAGWVAREAGVPHVSVALTPVAWNNPADPVPAYQLGPGAAHAAAARLAARLVDPPLRLVLGAWVRRLRRESGIASPRSRWPSVWEEFRAGDMVLGAWPAAFRSALPGDPHGAVLCGFPFLADPTAPLEASLATFLDRGEPPIVFTLGSAAVHHPREFFRLAIAACERLAVRGVLLTGRGNPPPAPLPAGVLAVEWAPHAALFRRARVNVHHAGIGSTAEALRAGRPSLAIPHAYDQFNNALRAEGLGAGLVLPRHRLTLDRLTRMLDRTLGDPAFAARAARLAPAMAAGGAEAAAIALEKVRPRTESSAAA